MQLKKSKTYKVQVEILRNKGLKINDSGNVILFLNHVKHKKDAKYGWYKYESRFALPVFAGDGEVERYNVFHVAMILRHDKDGKKYLYDIMNIKKETSDLFQSEDLTQ